MRTVKMLVGISGNRDGVEWPDLGGTIDLPDTEAEHMAFAGLVRILDEPKVERAVTRRKTETAVRKG